MYAQHSHLWISRYDLHPRLIRLDWSDQCPLWHHSIHFDQELLLVGLLALACALGIGKGRLFHGDTQRAGDFLHCRRTVLVLAGPVIKNLTNALDVLKQGLIIQLPV